MIEQSKNRVQCLYRVSSSKQVNYDDHNQADIPMQKKACREYAKKMGWIIVNEEQETGSGYKNSASSRDAIKRIKERAERKEFDILLVFMFDRIGRITNETPFVVEWLIQSGVRVVSVMEGEQCFANHVDHLVNYIRYWISEGESQKISMRSRTRLAQLVEEGHSKGGTAPYGYRYEQDKRTNRHGQRLLKLVIHEPEAETVRIIYDRYVNYGYGPQRISSYLREQYLKMRSDNNWHPSSIRGILRNLTYSGILRCAEARSEQIPALQIIDDETFSAAQKLHEERSDRTKSYVISKQPCRTLLAGNIYCGHCGSRLVLSSNNKSYTNKQGETRKWKQYRYLCYGKTRKQTECDGQTSYSINIVDGIITNIIHDILAEIHTPCKSKDSIDRKQQRMKALRAERKQLNSDLKSVSVSLTILEKEYAESVGGTKKYPIKSLSDAINHTTQQKNFTLKRLDIIRAELKRSEAILTHLHEQQTIAELSWTEMFDSADMETRRLVTSCLIENVAVCRGYDVSIKSNLMLEQIIE